MHMQHAEIFGVTVVTQKMFSVLFAHFPSFGLGVLYLCPSLRCCWPGWVLKKAASGERLGGEWGLLVLLLCLIFFSLVSFNLVIHILYLLFALDILCSLQSGLSINSLSLHNSINTYTEVMHMGMCAHMCTQCKCFLRMESVWEWVQSFLVNDLVVTSDSLFWHSDILIERLSGSKHC